ncbi:MAG: nucleoside deaminase [Bdellovibrionales bacterium]|nr:nucleoside deaminase [Bdellovibrionales bacterium]
MTKSAIFSNQDTAFMTKALKLAGEGFLKNEVPVGAVIVYKNSIIASAHNQKELLCDSTSHAEILALKQAQKKLKTWRLTDCTMFVTLEPCLMCAGAIIGTRLSNLIYGAMDPKTGAVDSLFNVLQDNRLNHQVNTRRGLLKEESAALLKKFFKQKREA